MMHLGVLTGGQGPESDPRRPDAHRRQRRAGPTLAWSAVSGSFGDLAIPSGFDPINHDGFPGGEAA